MPKRRKPFALTLSPRFARELQHQITKIAEHNLAAAEAASKRVTVALDRLTRFPDLGRPGRIAGTRELAVPRTRFIMAYRVSNAAIEVAALLHERQEWPSEL